MWFRSLAEIFHVLLLGLASYAALIVALRLAGKRALSQLNAFDWLVSVALGSILASTIVSNQISFSEGATGVGTLLLLQWLITFGSVRSSWLRRLVRSQPLILVRDGAYDEDAMRRGRVTRDEVEEAVRRAGIGRLAEVAAVVIETDGGFSIIRSQGDQEYDLIDSVGDQTGQGSLPKTGHPKSAR